MGPNDKVKEAFNLSTIRFHIIATWVGLLLNLFWWISDLIVLPSYSVAFLLFRIGVSLSSLLVLLFREKLGVNIYFCMFFLVTGISVQNAYMWSVMDVAHFQQHAFAYIVLFIGVGMLVLWSFRLSMVLLAITVISNVIFLSLNSSLSLEQILVNGGLLTLTVVIFTAFLIRSRYRLTIKEISIRLDLEESKREIEQKQELLETKNREITDSIYYARTIQQAVLPSTIELKEWVSDFFILNLPKNIVSGDFYWVHKSENKTFFVVGDCTGHGVPGGFMTMLGLSFLEDIVVAKQVEDPGTILNLLRERIISALNQKGIVGENKDGMDISLFVIDRNNRNLDYSGAYNDLHIVRKNELVTLKAMRQPCGYSPAAKPFETVHFELKMGDSIYATSDGYADQFGGEFGKKYRVKNLLQQLLVLNHLSLEDQRNVFLNTFEDWRGDLEQVDDVLLMGVRI